MSLFNRNKGSITYRYFKKGGTEQIYLGPVGKEDPEKVKQALAYVQNMKEKYLEHYEGLAAQLLALLPEEERLRIQAWPEKPTLQEKEGRQKLTMESYDEEMTVEDAVDYYLPKLLAKIQEVLPKNKLYDFEQWKKDLYEELKQIIGIS